MLYKMKWQDIHNADFKFGGDRTWGMEIPGVGVLVRHESWCDGYGQSESLTFVPNVVLKPINDVGDVFELVPMR